MGSQENLRAKASSFLEDPANLALLERVSNIVDSDQSAQRDAVMEMNENWLREAVLEEEAERYREAAEQEVEELQLHEDEGARVNRKRQRHNEALTKLEAIDWAKQNSIHSAARKFNVDRKVVKRWRGKEAEIRQQMNTAGGSKRKRLEGGGRPVLEPELDLELANWVKEMRENKRPVSRRIITSMAQEFFRRTDIKASIGWLNSFLKRHNFVLRRVTTTAQKPPENYAEVVAKFIVHVEQRRNAMRFNSIFAMDETAVWFDCPENRCIETRGAKDVTVVTTGHEKMRFTVCLAARSDGKKMLPYVLVKRKRPVPAIVNQFKGKLIINRSGSTWMNDSTTEDFLRHVIGGGLFSGKRLLVWDAFASHKSEATTAVLKELKVEVAYIPGGCTKFIQAPDVCWNKPLKEKIRHYYNIWMSNGDRQEFTAAGNPKAPALEVVLEWVHRAWEDLSKDMIIKSFKACALTTPTDGSGDDKIACFKPEGSIGPIGLELLRNIRAEQRAEDGRNDEEEAGISDEEMDLENVVDDKALLFDV